MKQKRRLKISGPYSVSVLRKPIVEGGRQTDDDERAEGGRCGTRNAEHNNKRTQQRHVKREAGREMRLVWCFFTAQRR